MTTITPFFKKSGNNFRGYVRIAKEQNRKTLQILSVPCVRVHPMDALNDAIEYSKEIHT